MIPQEVLSKQNVFDHRTLFSSKSLTWITLLVSGQKKTNSKENNFLQFTMKKDPKSPYYPKNLTVTWKGLTEEANNV